MASPSERRRNNVRMGIFVSISLILAIAVIVVLSGAWRSITLDTSTYTVVYPVSAGVKNLKPGADVRIGGVVMGTVEAIEPVADADPFDRIEVNFSIDSRVRLYSNARIVVSAALIGSDAWLAISSVGGAAAPDGAAPAEIRALAPGDALDGTVVEGMLASLLGAGNAAKTDRIFSNVEEFSEFLPEIRGEYNDRIVPIIDKTGTMIDDAGATVAAVREDYGRWRESVDRIVSNVNSSTERIDSLIADNRADVDAFIANMREFSDDAPVISEDVRTVAARFRDETMDKVDELLDRGRDGVNSFASVAEKLDVEFDRQWPNVSDALANARLASEQLKLTTIEVRRSPWKLLYRPGADELEHELLYEAARSFAVAASDLKAASESVERVIANHGEAFGADDQRVLLLRDNLLESFQRYERAQQKLLDVLIADEP
jgi:ABC-type transporter Mla subunit MlaD